MITDEERIRDLEREVRRLSSVVVYTKNQMRIAGKYQNEDLEARVNGIQAALLRAAEYEGKTDVRRRR